MDTAVTSTAALLERLARPYEPAHVVAAMLGLPTRFARQLVGAALACSREAEELLAALPQLMRSLAIATTDRPVRCYGELRGPVLWSETMSARSASAGDPGLYVCATTTKAYDTDENRVLKLALDTIRAAGHAAEYGRDAAIDDVTRAARHNGHVAARMLEHQALSAVPVARLTGRALRRTRAGSRRARYRPALAVLRRAADPVGVEHLDPLVDRYTRARNALLVDVLEGVERAVGAVPPLRSSHGSLVAGVVRFHHPGRRNDDGELDGVRVGDVLLDVPHPGDLEPDRSRARLEARAGALLPILVVEPADVDRAIERAGPALRGGQLSRRPTP